MLLKIKKYFQRKFRKNTLKYIETEDNFVEERYFELYSDSLERKVKVVAFLPPGFSVDKNKLYPIILFNDGQDMERLEMKSCLEQMYDEKAMQPKLVFGIYAGDRIHEYGTALKMDYAQRGSKAGAYSQFLLEQFLPYVYQNFPCKMGPLNQSIAGFSLGGLSAFDMAWNHSDVFGQVGVFSGSLWWRSKEFDETDPDADRIVHDLVAESKAVKDLRFWFQTGTNDETSDRNNNGVIDAIDDTLDLIAILKKVGYQESVIHYEEVEEGEHKPETWGAVMPLFLKFIDQNSVR